MRKQMIENAAYEVATQVRAVEDSIEAALGEIAELQLKMVSARSVTGAGFVQFAMRPSSSLSLQRRGLVAARGGNRQLPRRAGRNAQVEFPGLRTVSCGDGAIARQPSAAPTFASSREGIRLTGPQRCGPV